MLGFVCLMLLTVSFSLSVSRSLPSGGTLIFFPLGLAAMVAWRGILTHVLASALANGGLAQRRVIVIAESGQLSSDILQESHHCGFNSV